MVEQYKLPFATERFFISDLTNQPVSAMIKMKYMPKKIKLAILFGGKSAEHEISIKSAKNIYNALNKKKYFPYLFWISKSGEWYLCKDSIFSLEDINNNSARQYLISRAGFLPGGKGSVFLEKGKNKKIKVDAVFPILHGPFGEDGSIQGLLRISDIPFVGSGVLGSAVGMDKDVMKRLLIQAGLPVGKYLAIRKNDTANIKRIEKFLGWPIFVKPASLGSSVGISKASGKNELVKAMKLAFQYDNKIVLEKFLEGREIECAVLGNEKAKASLPGEIKVYSDFYSYKTKYLDEKSSELVYPAKLSQGLIKKIQTLAVRTFKTLECEGLSRVDFFLKKDGSIFVNEINTMPGFTSISMYPKLMELMGYDNSVLIDNLIELAFSRYKREKRISIRGK